MSKPPQLSESDFVRATINWVRCSGKARFTTELAAQNRALELMLTYYPCECGGWHLTKGWFVNRLAKEATKRPGSSNGRAPDL